MRKIKAFFYVLIKSITSVDYYKELLKVSPHFSIKYYVTLCLLLTLITSCVITTKITPELRNQFRSFTQEMLTNYPEDLVIKVYGGNVEINRPEPYFIDAPNMLTEEAGEEIEHLVTIDSSGTINDLEQYKTLALINDKNLLVRDRGNIQAYPLNELPNGELTKADLIRIDGEIQSLLKYVFVVVFILVFGIYVVYYSIFRTIALIAFAGVISIIGNVKGLKLGLGKYIQLTMHIVTLPLIVESLVTILQVNVPIPLWFMVLTILIGFVVIFELSEKE